MANKPSYESIYTMTIKMPAFIDADTKKAYNATTIRLPIYLQTYLCKHLRDVFKANDRITEIYRLLKSSECPKEVNGLKYPNLSVAICAYLITHDLANYKLSLNHILDDDPAGMVIV